MKDSPGSMTPTSAPLRSSTPRSVSSIVYQLPKNTHNRTMPAIAATMEPMVLLVTFLSLIGWGGFAIAVSNVEAAIGILNARHEKALNNQGFNVRRWRRRWDSNSWTCYSRRFSRPLP
ncbi:hypothetical protein EMIT043CA1_30057 [Pseudomonas brassicacearum]